MLLIMANLVQGQSRTVITAAGTGSNSPIVNGAATCATFDAPKGIAIDSQGVIYIGDQSGRLRKMTPQGVVSTVAGGGTLIDGYGTYTILSMVTGLTVLPDDSVIAVEAMHRIRRIQPNGYVDSFAGISGVNALTDGWGTYGRFSSPYGLTRDTSGNVYVGDTGNARIRKITPAGYVSTLAGTGYTHPRDPVFDSKGNMFVTDATAGKIWKVAVGATTPLTFAGKGSAGYTDGQGSLAAFNRQFGITADEDDILYVAEEGNHRVRAISPTGLVSTIAGVGTSAMFINGAATVATFSYPYSIASDKKGSLYVTDTSNNRVRRIIMCKAGSTFNSTTVSCMCASGFKMELNRTCTACPDGYQSDETRTNCVIVAATATSTTETIFDAAVVANMATQPASKTGTAINNQTVTITNDVSVTVDQITTSTLSMTLATQIVAGSNAAFVCPSYSQCDSTTFQCLAGYRITDDLNGCTLCDIGLIKSSIGNQQICTQCPIGQEPATNQIVCIDCQQGKYKPTQDFFLCVDCPIEGSCNTTSFNPPQSTRQQKNGSNASTSIESIIQLPMSTLILIASALGVGLVVGTMTSWICCSVRSSHTHQKRNQPWNTGKSVRSQNDTQQILL